MTKFPYHRYTELEAILKNKRKHMPYKRIWNLFYGCGTFAIRASVAIPGGLELVSYYNAKRAFQSQGKVSVPHALVTAFPGCFIFHDQPTGNPILSRLILWLTHGHYELRKYSLRATNGTHALWPAFSWNGSTEGKHLYHVPALGLDGIESYWDGNIRRQIREHAYGLITRNGFTYYPGKGPVSHEPVLKRQWVPGKRTEYLHKVKELRKHGEIRAKMGAFDSQVDRFFLDHQSRYLNPQQLHDWQRQLVKCVIAGAIDEHETYKKIMEAGLLEYGTWRRSVDHDRIPELFNSGLEKMREGLRLSSGAVVYS